MTRHTGQVIWTCERASITTKPSRKRKYNYCPGIQAIMTCHRLDLMICNVVFQEFRPENAFRRHCHHYYSEAIAIHIFFDKMKKTWNLGEYCCLLFFYHYFSAKVH